MATRPVPWVICEVIFTIQMLASFEIMMCKANQGVVWVIDGIMQPAYINMKTAFKVWF